MRLRLAVLASLLAAVTAAAAPTVASAAPKHNHDLTIRAVPSRIIAGDPILIYGHLSGPDNADQLIRLYHKVNPHLGYSLIGTTQTNASGFYEFTRADGIVMTNRSWFVRGPDSSHSRTVHESVEALVSLNSTTTNVDTRHDVAFFGAVQPSHPFQRIWLQVRNGSGDDWHTVKGGFTRAGSGYRIDYRWSLPGSYDVRTVLSGDSRNMRSYSDPASLLVQQAQRPYFSINSSSPVIRYGSSAVISGVLDKTGTGTPDAGVPVTLLARNAGGVYSAVATSTTGSNGAYSFTQLPTENTLYVVQVTLNAHRRTSALYEAVRDVVSGMPSSSTAPAGSTITFSGSVLPGKAGDAVYLQRRSADGDYHTVAVSSLNGLSAYSISWTLGDAGTDTFRVRVLADRFNAGGASDPMAITVTQPPVSTLPTAS